MLGGNQTIRQLAKEQTTPKHLCAWSKNDFAVAHGNSLDLAKRGYSAQDLSLSPPVST